MADISAMTTNHEDDSRSVEQLVIPRKCRKVALELAHDVPMGGHLGSLKTLDRLLSRFYWPGIIPNVGQHRKRCEACQKSSGRKIGKHAHLVSLLIIEERFRE